MMKIQRMTSVLLVLVMLIVPVAVEAGSFSDAVHNGWNAGYQAGQNMISTLSGIVNGALHAVGAAVAGAVGLVAGVVASLGKWAKKVVEKVKEWTMKVVNWVKGVANKIKEKFKKFWANVKKFWQMLVDAYHTGYNSVAGGNNTPGIERVAEIKSDRFENELGQLLMKHQEARFNYVAKKSYQKNFDHCGAMQKSILDQVERSIETRDYVHYNALMDTLKRLTDAKNQSAKAYVHADDIMAFAPVLSGLRAKIKAKYMRSEGQEAKNLKEMYEEVDYYVGYARSFSEKFYKKGAVKIPDLR